MNRIEQATGWIVGFGICLCMPLQYAHAQWYMRTMLEKPLIEIRGETADTTRLGDDRYIEDNLDFILTHNEWVIVNFSAYWCPDSERYAPDFLQAAVMDRYADIVWCYADVDVTRGNENFRKRFDLPGIPVTILFHDGAIVKSPQGESAILDGHKDDQDVDDLLSMLDRFYTQKMQIGTLQIENRKTDSVRNDDGMD